ncbi:DUF58 domain-containing protein [Kineococcus sp. SYSU DK002]|uniref:DUF58 domain-containing protein n=1 Tax=Kineococcus sp. SYSU DK002 TaxID=3383123 RepID=UPI003D7D5E06
MSAAPGPAHDPAPERLLDQHPARPRVRVRPIALATAGPALLVLSLGVGNRWLALVACLLLAVTALSVLTAPPVTALAVSVRVPPRARAGQDVEHVVRVRNTSSRPCPAVVLHLGGDGFAPAHAGVPDLAAGQAVELRLPRAARSRGVSAGPVVLVEAADVLGVHLQRRWAAAPAVVAVHPAPTTVPALPVPAPRAGADDLAALRPFRTGDRASAVHRRTSARRGGGPGGPALVVVEREAAPEGLLVVVLPTSPAGFEDVLGQVAALLEAERRAGRRVAVLDGAAPSPRAAEGAAALDVLAAAQPSPTPPAVASALDRARRAAGPHGRVVVAGADGWRSA